jgi:transposase
MAWKTMDVHEQRVRFVVEAMQKMRPFKALRAVYEISRPTGYLWLERYRQHGVAGIAEQSRKPHRSPQRTDSELERQVVELRLRYPDWGARKLRVVLAREGVELPRNTIHRILLRHHLVRAEERHSPAPQRFERAQPNELWQMDFKGPKGWPHPVGPLSVLDDHSRYLIALADNGSTHGTPVREQLEEAFHRCGVPEGMLMDHGTPWWSQKSVVVADAPRHPVELEWHSTSTNAREGGALPRIAAARSATAWRATRENASLAGCLPLGAQPCAPARSAGHPDAGHALAAQHPALRSASAALGVSLRRLGFETGLSRTVGYPGTEVESQ